MGCFSLSGKTHFAVLKGSKNTMKFLKIMKDVLSMLLDRKTPASSIYQEDNAPIHVNPSARSRFDGKEVPSMVWNSTLPDLNQMEKI